MISCYFILLIKIHKKQNGQLARPFIPQVLAVLFWRGLRACGWLHRQPPADLWDPLSSPLPLCPHHLCCDSCCTWSASRWPLEAPPLSPRWPDTPHFSPFLTSSFSHIQQNISLSPLLPQPDYLPVPPSFQGWFKSLLFQEAHPDRNGLGQLRMITCSPFNQASMELPPQHFLSRKIGRIHPTPPQTVRNMKFELQCWRLWGLPWAWISGTTW